LFIVGIKPETEGKRVCRRSAERLNRTALEAVRLEFRARRFYNRVHTSQRDVDCSLIDQGFPIKNERANKNGKSSAR